MKHIKNESGARSVWPEAVVSLKLTTAGRANVVFGGDESFESLEFNRTDWEKLGAPLALSVYLTKER